MHQYAPMGLQQNALTFRTPPLAGHHTAGEPEARYPGGQVSLQDDPAWRPAHAVALTLGWTLASVHVGAGQ
jgi:hypothetical protein